MKAILAPIVSFVVAFSVAVAASEPKRRGVSDSKSKSESDANESESQEKRKIYFSNVSLRYIADHFAAVSGRKISVASEIATLKIGGRIKISDVDAFLRMLPQVLPVRVEVASDRSVQILPRNPRK